MKKLFRLHFVAIAVIDLLLLAFFSKRPETSLEWLLLSGFIFLLTQGLLLFRLVVRLKHQFAEIYPQINKKIRFYYLGVLSIDFLFFVLLAFVSSQRFALQILLWDNLIILSLLFLSGVPLFLQGTLLILGHLIPSYRTCQILKRDFPKAYQEQISFWSIL